MRFQAFGPAGQTPVVTMRLLNAQGDNMAALPAPDEAGVPALPGLPAQTTIILAALLVAAAAALVALPGLLKKRGRDWSWLWRQVLRGRH